MSSFGWVSYTPHVPASAAAAPDAVRPELADVGRLLRRGVRGAVVAARAAEQPSLTSLLAEHLGPGAEQLDVVQESWPGYEHVNVQAGLDAWLPAGARLVGIVGFRHFPFGLAELLQSGPTTIPARPGAVARANLACDPGGEVRACVRCGLYLVQDDEGARTALLLRGPEPDTGIERVTVEVVSTGTGRAGQVAAKVREAADEHNVFRGQVLSFGSEMFGPDRAVLSFHERPVVDPTGLVLPAQVLDAVRRQVVGVGRHRDRLLAAGQHLKRGVLLFGPSGTGKTHTVRHLVAELTGTTVIQLSGNALHLIGEAASVARALQPSMVVVEDVDLIAEDRGAYAGANPLLSQLLNEMDGLADDADVVFVLTTNRADLLEPALAAEESAGALVVGLPQMTAALTELMDTRNAVTRAALGGS